MSNTEHPDDDLAALLQGLPQPEPSAELDTAILAQAEQALAKPGAANDEYYPGARKSFVHRHRVPLSLAATLLIAANLALMEPSEKPARRAVEAAMAPVEVNVVDTIKPAAPPPALPAVIAAGESVQASPAPRAIEAAPPRPAEPEPPAEAPAAAAPPAPAPLQQVTVSGSSIKADVQEEMKKELAKPIPDQRRFAASPPPLAPADELTEIIAQEQRGELVAAGKAWRAFVQRYPGYPVPAELKARLDALPVD